MIAIGEVAAFPYGTIERLSETRFLATTPTGRHRRSAANVRLPAVAYRWCENRLLRAAGLPMLPELCAWCGERPRLAQKPYCSLGCRLSAHSARVSSAKEHALRTDAEVLAQIHALTPEPEPRATTPYVNRTGYGVREMTASFSIAREQADALIRRRGGIVPRVPGAPLTCEQVEQMAARVALEQAKAG